MMWCLDNKVDVLATDLPNLALDTFARAQSVRTQTPATVQA